MNKMDERLIYGHVKYKDDFDKIVQDELDRLANESLPTKEEICELFQIEMSELEGVTFLFFYYDIEFYDGYAIILFKKDGKLYEVLATHCSCFGLERQWSPDETTWDAVKHSAQAAVNRYHENRKKWDHKSSCMDTGVESSMLLLRKEDDILKMLRD